ncbi:triacylglycerol lipase [Streptococcus pneumoniae]|nr:triacylglycerol lipase [Streptococcus pneumoniae]
MTDTYTDYERFQIAKKEYDKELAVDKPVEIGDNDNAKPIGTVRQVIEDETGLKALVVESPDKSEISVLYEGSKEPGKDGWEVDWKVNDIPMAKNIITNKKEVTPQLESAATTLNNVLEKYPNAKISVYAHSLGSMDAQYALANVRDISRISGAYIYQGPNIYPVLTKEQRQRVDAMKYRIHNYIDQRDAVPIGYPKDAPGYKAELNSKNAVGIVHHVDSNFNWDPVVAQHMWGGYVFNEDGSLRIKKDTSSFEKRYSSFLDKVSSGLYNYVKAKETLASGGYTRGEEIFLDSEQALTISSGLHEVANAGHEEIRSIVRKAHQKAEKIVASTYQVPFGFILSPTEVATAYSDGGVSRTTILDDLDHYFYPKIKKSEKLAEDFQSLEKQIADGVQKKLEDDKELAGNFKEWMKIK